MNPQPPDIFEDYGKLANLEGFAMNPHSLLVPESTNFDEMVKKSDYLRSIRAKKNGIIARLNNRGYEGLIAIQDINTAFYLSLPEHLQIALRGCTAFHYMFHSTVPPDFVIDNPMDIGFDPLTGDYYPCNNLATTGGIIMSHYQELSDRTKDPLFNYNSQY